MSFKKFLRSVLGLSARDVRKIRKQKPRQASSITRDDRGRWILDPEPASKDQCQCKKPH